MTFLTIENLRKSFGAQDVVRGFDLCVEKGEFISFLGSSGCGKTTTLRMIAGFETPSGGSIRIDGKDIAHLPPNRRNIGMVFQSYALFPNMSVADNVAFGLKVAGKPQAEIDTRVAEMLQLIKLPDLATRYPYQLSGGQQQRVALARALATKPQILLLDEPLSALDAKIRVSLREEIREVQRALGITTIYVTHDQEEALSMSDRIVVMSEGQIEQVGTPFEVYNFPKTRFVASFVGTLNLLNAKITDAASGNLEIDGQAISTSHTMAGNKTGWMTTAAIRPEAIGLDTKQTGAEKNDDSNTLVGMIEAVNFLGSVVRMRVRLREQTVSLDVFNDPGKPAPACGDPVILKFARKDVLPLDSTEA